MASILGLAQVWIWNKFVGAVSEEDDGRITFEYDEAFRRSGFEISPRKLPLSLRVLRSRLALGPALLLLLVRAGLLLLWLLLLLLLLWLLLLLVLVPCLFLLVVVLVVLLLLL